MALTCGFCLDGADSVYTSAQFSETFQAVFGDGICPYGDKFSLTAVENLTVTIGTGYALAAGRWLGSDEPHPLTLTPADNYADRWDAVAVRADYPTKKVYLEILADVDPSLPPRNGNEYALFLHLIRVKRGATVLTAEDITDTRGDKSLCGYITPLSEMSGRAEYVYAFLRSGIDEEVARILALGESVAQRVEGELKELDGRLAAVSGTAVGDITLALTRSPPTPYDEWLLCDGSSVPEGYPALSAAVGGTLPAMAAADGRWSWWIYGGPPA